MQDSTRPLPEEIRSLLHFAVMAPSSHNTQPWRFAIRGTRVLLYADRTRSLPVNDPDDRELIISCGCALMNLRAAAAHAGMHSEVRPLPEPGDRDLLAAVELRRGNIAPPAAELFPAIPRRRTCRKRFRDKAVDAGILRELGRQAEAEGAWLEAIETATHRRRVAALVAQGDALQWSDPRWRRELAFWMRPRHRGDGLAVPGVMAPLVRSVVRRFNMGKRTGAADSALAAQSPVLALLGTDSDSPQSRLGAGQALERVLLRACLEGLQASYLNQPIQVASLRPKLQALAGRPGFPQILLRLGYPEKAPAASPRRPPEAVLLE